MGGQEAELDRSWSVSSHEATEGAFIEQVLDVPLGASLETT